jgi:hypothetical protein
MEQHTAERIKANAIYRDPGQESYLPDAPPEGCVFVRRYSIGDSDKKYMIGEPWPTLQVGQRVEVETTNHYIWAGVIERIDSPDDIMLRPSGPKCAMSLPPVTDPACYRLPYISGDAWSVRPEAGKILLIEDRPYKVIGKPKPVRGSNEYAYSLREVPPDQYAGRAGRVVIENLTDPNPESYRYYMHSVGRIIVRGLEYLHVERIERVPYGDGEGREIFGYTTYGVGHFVAAEKATALAAAWEAKDKIRSLELSLKVARQDLDYGGNPDACSCLECELAEARKSA